MVNESEDNIITGYIRLYRSFIKWEWFDVPNMVTVFIYCLLKANHKDKDWRGITIKRGQFITSYETISKDTRLSVRSIRTCIKKLILTQELTKQSTNRFTILTICKYDAYQDLKSSSDKPPDSLATNKRQTNDKQVTTTNNDNNDNNEKEENIVSVFSFKKSLLKMGIRENLAADFLKNRRLKKLADTETAFNLLKRELEKNDMPINDLMTIIVANGWGGFKNEWLNRKKVDLNGKMSLAEKMKLQYGIK